MCGLGRAAARPRESGGRRGRGDCRPRRPGDSGRLSPHPRREPALRPRSRSERPGCRCGRWRLSTMVDFGSGVVMPAWPADEAALTGLLDDLLEATLPPAELVRRCRLWLDGRPAVAAWVVDEGRPEIGAPTGETDESRPAP